MMPASSSFPSSIHLETRRASSPDLDADSDPDSDWDVDATLPLHPPRTSSSAGAGRHEYRRRRRGPLHHLSSISSSSYAQLGGGYLFSLLKSWRRRYPVVSSPRAVVLVCAGLKFGVVFSATLMIMPFYRLMLDAFCHRVLRDESPGLLDEGMCQKERDVQSQLGYLMATVGVLNALFGLLAAFPYGVMADRVGRKPTVLFAFSSVAFQFTMGSFGMKYAQPYIRQNPWILTWGSPMTLIGGGIPVLFSTLYAMASDVSSEAERASNFIYLGLGPSIAGLLGPLVSGGLMAKFGPWVPLTIAGCITPFLFFPILLLPETLARLSHGGASSTPTGFPQPNHHESPHRKPPVAAEIKRQFHQGLSRMASSLFLLKDRNILLTLSVFVVQSIVLAGYMNTLPLYTTRNFDWTLAQTSFLLSPLTVLSIAVLAALPKLSAYLLSPACPVRLTAFEKDLYLARTSLAFLVAASLTQALSPSISVFVFGLALGSFGMAKGPVSRSVITAFVRPHQTSALYGLMATAEIIGSLFGAPVLAWCFDFGMRVGGVWTGAPWFYMALVVALALTAMCFVQQPHVQLGQHGDDDDDDDDDDENRGVRDEETAVGVGLHSNRDGEGGYHDDDDNDDDEGSDTDVLIDLDGMQSRAPHS